jgi:hypothetical protein
MVRWRPKQGQGVGDLVLIDCARGLDAQAESWRLQGHIDSGCQKEAPFVVPGGLAFGNKPVSATARHGSGLFPVPTVPFLVRADVINTYGDRRAALDMLVRAAEHDVNAGRGRDEAVTRA